MTVEHDPAKTAPHVMEERPIPLYQRVLAGSLVVILFALIVVWPHRLVHDFWPIDQGVAANILASLVQWAAVMVALVLLWPPTRRRLHWMIDAKLAPIHEHLDVIRQHHEHAERHRDQTDRAIAKIHQHLEIEPDEPGTIPEPPTPHRGNCPT